MYDGQSHQYSVGLRLLFKFRGRFAGSLLVLGPIFLGIILLGIILPVATLAEEPSPVGLWRTIDDKTHKPRGTVRIYEENGEYFGRIESSFDPAERDKICEKCSGDRKNKPVIGLVIMRGMMRHGAEYGGGEILDPENGTTYKCRFTLSGDGERLIVQGYFLVPIIGRSQIWLRER